MRVACLVTNLFEDSELSEPKKAMEEDGHEVVVISASKDEIKGERGKVQINPDATIDEVSADEFDALFIPGGFSPDRLRADDRFVDFVKDFDQLNRPIFAICHGPQLLLTADVLDGHQVTAWKTIRSDLNKAGIDVVDREVVVDDNLVTSRSPSDIPAFNRAVLKLLSAEEGRPTTGISEQPAAH
jgi:protease I